MTKLEKLIEELCPNGVEYKTIPELFNTRNGYTPSKSKKEYWENGTIPWLSSGEVNKKHISFTDNFITKIGYDSCSTKMIPANTVVMALAGQGKTRGTVAITEIELCTNQSLASIVTNETVDDKFLLYYQVFFQFLYLKRKTAENCFFAVSLN